MPCITFLLLHPKIWRNYFPPFPKKSENKKIRRVFYFLLLAGGGEILSLTNRDNFLRQFFKLLYLCLCPENPWQIINTSLLHRWPMSNILKTFSFWFSANDRLGFVGPSAVIGSSCYDKAIGDTSSWQFCHNFFGTDKVQKIIVSPGVRLDMRWVLHFTRECWVFVYWSQKVLVDCI